MLAEVQETQLCDRPSRRARNTCVKSDNSGETEINDVGALNAGRHLDAILPRCHGVMERWRNGAIQQPDGGSAESKGARSESGHEPSVQTGRTDTDREFTLITHLQHSETHAINY